MTKWLQIRMCSFFWIADSQGGMSYSLMSEYMEFISNRKTFWLSIKVTWKNPLQFWEGLCLQSTYQYTISLVILFRRINFKAELMGRRVTCGCVIVWKMDRVNPGSIQKAFARASSTTNNPVKGTDRLWVVVYTFNRFTTFILVVATTPKNLAILSESRIGRVNANRI